jgi:hypothetical protein
MSKKGTPKSSRNSGRVRRRFTGSGGRGAALRAGSMPGNAAEEEKEGSEFLLSRISQLEDANEQVSAARPVRKGWT